MTERDTSEDIKMWKDILYKDGKIDEEQVMKELLDYSFILDQIPEVYCEITRGLLSKPNYFASTILAEFHDKFSDNEITKEDIKDIVYSTASTEDKLNSIKEYFNIPQVL